MSKKWKSINCKGHLIDFETPKIMGILNITPDSFFDGGKNLQIDQALQSTSQMLLQGASFLDVGGYSSRPGANDISIEEEAGRVLPVIEAILKEFPQALISIDTFRSTVAKQAVEAGAAMINDISGGHLDDDMLQTVAKLQVPYIAMHMRGTPQTMKTLTHYNDLIREIKYYFAAQLHNAKALGINDLIIDPGFGFAKTLEQNYALLDHMNSFNDLNCPILAGVSRKSMIYKQLGGTAAEALNGTTALNAWALDRGANILRVHDVGPAMECVKLHQALKESRD